MLLVKQKAGAQEGNRHVIITAEKLEDHLTLTKQESLPVVLGVKQHGGAIACAQAIALLSATNMRHLDVTTIARCVLFEATNFF